MDEIDRKQQEEINALHNKNLEQDLTLEKMSRLVDRVQNMVVMACVLCGLLVAVFLLFKTYTIRVEIQDNQAVQAK